MPLSTIKSNIEYGFVTATTSYGQNGIKVWICLGTILDFKTSFLKKEMNSEHVLQRRIERNAYHGSLNSKKV
jgi:ribosomal protein S3